MTANRQGNNRSTGSTFRLKEVGSQRPPEEPLALAMADPMIRLGWWLGWFANKRLHDTGHCDLETED